jgi:uncharacterized membrane protein SpoIIM required for sporulation
MQETDFIIQNKEKWSEFEQVLKNTNKDPERITDLFIETTDDLSYSRTYYPNRSVRVYLNGISQQIYQTIYKNKSGEKNVFRKFWLEDLPVAMWHSRIALLWSFLLFAAGVSIGIFSSMYYPDFARIILGDSYIEMTEANIAHGDPMAVYKDEEPILMFLRIAWNNIRIAFGTFALGIFFGIGTVYIILSNAIMVGAFIYFFIERDLFRESFLAIMLHGTLELSMIVIAGCAGFALAKGLIMPGTYNRGQALIHSARNGIKILVGVAVLLVYAAFIESFATRYTEMPDAIRALIILMSFTIVIGYFVVYPYRLHKRGKIGEPDHEEIPGNVFVDYKLNTIKSSGKIFTEVFSLFSKNSKLIALLSLLLSLVITVAYGIFTKGEYHEIFTSIGYRFNLFSGLNVWEDFSPYLRYKKFPLAIPLFLGIFAAFSLVIIHRANKTIGTHSKIMKFGIFNAIVIGATTFLPVLLPKLVTFIVMPVWTPICLLWLYISIKENKFCLITVTRLFKLMKGNFWRIVGTFISTLAIQWIVMFIINTQLTGVLSEFIQMNIPKDMYLAPEVPFILQTFLLFYVFIFIGCLSFFGTVLLYHSIKEINEANSLISSIEHIGFKKRAYGLEKE